jgi:hypothetical protein
LVIVLEQLLEPTVPVFVHMAGKLPAVELDDEFQFATHALAGLEVRY